MDFIEQKEGGVACVICTIEGDLKIHAGHIMKNREGFFTFWPDSMCPLTADDLRVISVEVVALNNPNRKRLKIATLEETLHLVAQGDCSKEEAEAHIRKLFKSLVSETADALQVDESTQYCREMELNIDLI